MSLWFRTRDKDGTVHHVSIPFEPLSFIALIGIGGEGKGVRHLFFRR